MIERLSVLRVLILTRVIISMLLLGQRWLKGIAHFVEVIDHILDIVERDSFHIVYIWIIVILKEMRKPYYH